MAFPYELIDLTHTLHEGIPTWPGHCGFNHNLHIDYSDCDGEDKFRVMKVSMYAGIATHLDAPSHCIPGGKCIHDFDVNDLIMPCVVIDVSDKCHERYQVSPQDVTDFESKYGRILKGSCVFVKTGWSTFWNEPSKYHNNHINPSVSPEAASLLLERGVSALGIDTLSADLAENGFKVHKIFLGAGKILIENVANLDKMKKIIGFIFVILTCYYNTCFAQIIKTNDIKVIEETLTSIDQDTLVIFDVDEILMMPKDQILQSPHREYINKSDTFLCASEQESENLWSIIFAQRPSIPVDPKMIKMMTTLQSKGIKVIALTHCVSGKFGYITSMKDWRYHELMRHGYDFEKSWKGMQNKTFNGLEKSRNRLALEVSSPPMFFKGIIFTEIDKGETLEAFLNHYKLKFKKIIFIDDRKKNLESVEKTLSKLNIAFVGIEYAAAVMQIEPLNKKRAELQFQVLGKQRKWLCDSEADALLTETNN